MSRLRHVSFVTPRDIVMITYQLRHRRHNLTLLRKSGSTTQCDFITRMLFKDSY